MHRRPGRLSVALLVAVAMARVCPGQNKEEAATSFFKNHANAIDLDEKSDHLWFANRRVGIGISKSEHGFELARLYSVEHDQDFLASNIKEPSPSLFQIVMKPDPAFEKQMKPNPFVIGPLSAKAVSVGQSGDDAQSTLRLEWKGINVSDDSEAMDVEVMVTLKANDPFSYWRFRIKNRSIKHGVERVYFPILNLAPIGDAKDNVYIYPTDRGRLVEDPFHQPSGYGDGVHRSGRYPGAFGMQFQALYNRRSGTGLYLATHDPTPNLKNTEAPNCPTHIAWKPAHFPPNIAFANCEYALPYDCVVGPFSGDWWDACQIYRRWALKQSWCRHGPLAERKDIPTWFKEAPMFLVTNSWCDNDNVAKTVEHYLKFLQWTGMRLPCNWYAWKRYQTDLTAYDVPHSYWRRGYRNPGPCSNVHDGNYPRLPALPGFSEACKRLRQAGGMVCPYVCLQIYDQGPTDNAPYANDARPYVVRDTQGAMQTYGREPSWAMCTWPQWWRDRLKEACVTLLQKENVGGFYLDTMHGCGEHCYWTPHGHTACGGDALPTGMHGLSQYVRDAVKAKDPDVITTGEDSAENMIDVIDGKLYQRTLAPNTRAPLFAAVYQDYITRYGMTIHTDTDVGFYMEVGSLFVEGAQIGRLPLDPISGGLSFENPDHKEMIEFLGRLVAYYRNDTAKKFLCYGQLMRPPVFAEPDPMPVLSYVVDGRSVALPALQSGVFRSRDDDLGIFIVNTSAEDISFVCTLVPQKYDMPADVTMDIESISPDGTVKPYEPGAKPPITIRDRLPARQMALFRLKRHK